MTVLLILKAIVAPLPKYKAYVCCCINNSLSSSRPKTLCESFFMKHKTQFITKKFKKYNYKIWY